MNTGIATKRLGSLFSDPFAMGGREMNELFDRVFELPGNGRARGSWLPAATVWEDEKSYHVDVELPGVDRDQVEVTFEEGRLVLSAKRPRPEGEYRTHHDERSWGEVTRAFALPETVDAESIEANLANGILSINLVKRPEVLPRKIEISSKP
jgi:HSP20 family protein